MGGNPGYSRWSTPFYWLMEPNRLWLLALVLVLFIPEAWTRPLWVNWLASIARLLVLVGELPAWVDYSELALVSLALILATLLFYRLFWNSPGAGGKMMVSGMGAMTAAALLLFLVPGREHSGFLFLSCFSLMAGGFLLAALGSYRRSQ